MSEPTFYQLADQLHSEMESLRRKYPGIHTILYRPSLGEALTRSVNELERAIQESTAAIGALLLPALEEFTRALSQLEHISLNLTRWESIRVWFWTAIWQEWRAARIINEAFDRED